MLKNSEKSSPISRKRIYIAGPMRGLVNWNVAAFDLAEKAWTEAGWHVFSPAAIVRAMGYAWGDSAPTEPDGNGPGSAHLKHVLNSDITCLIHSDAIALLPGWERSRGATASSTVAQFLGLEVYDAVTMERLDPPMTPWRRVVARMETGAYR